MLLTCKNFIFSDFTREKKIAPENGGGEGLGWCASAPLLSSLTLRPCAIVLSCFSWCSQLLLRNAGKDPETGKLCY